MANRLREGESCIKKYEYNVLPANSYIPFNPNPEFTGRHVDLIELYLKIIGNLNKIGINQVGAVGMGGSAKHNWLWNLCTVLALRLAVSFGYRQQMRNGGVQNLWNLPETACNYPYLIRINRRPVNAILLGCKNTSKIIHKR
jgi:hypothetical protein